MGWKMTRTPRPLTTDSIRRLRSRQLAYRSCEGGRPYDPPHRPAIDQASDRVQHLLRRHTPGEEVPAPALIIARTPLGSSFAETAMSSVPGLTRVIFWAARGYASPGSFQIEDRDVRMLLRRHGDRLFGVAARTDDGDGVVFLHERDQGVATSSARLQRSTRGWGPGSSRPRSLLRREPTFGSEPSSVGGGLGHGPDEPSCRASVRGGRTGTRTFGPSTSGFVQAVHSRPGHSRSSPDRRRSRTRSRRPPHPSGRQRRTPRRRRRANRRRGARAGSTPPPRRRGARCSAARPPRGSRSAERSVTWLPTHGSCCARDWPTAPSSSRRRKRGPTGSSPRTPATTRSSMRSVGSPAGPRSWEQPPPQAIFGHLRRQSAGSRNSRP